MYLEILASVAYILLAATPAHTLGAELTITTRSNTNAHHRHTYEYNLDNNFWHI